MAVLTPLVCSRAGINSDPATAASAAGDEVDNPVGDVAFLVKNASGAPITVTLLIRAAGPDGAAVTNPTVTVPAAGERLIGPFPPSVYNDASGRAKVTYSATTSVTVAALKFNP